MMVPPPDTAPHRYGYAGVQRRRLMEAWAAYCAKPSAGGKMVSRRRRARWQQESILRRRH
jgi:hypothetical protein